MLNSTSSAIAIIDSGIGGISILNQLIHKFGVGNFIYFADNKYMPYGNKSKEFVKNRIIEIIGYLKTNYNVSKIIIACNTASTCLHELKLDNVEVLTFNKSQTYLTTYLTHKNLIGYNTIPDKTLAKKIEKKILDNNYIDRLVKNHVKRNKLNQLKTLVLGCTHYELVAEKFEKYCPKTKIILNSYKIVKETKTNEENELKITIILSKLNEKYSNKIIKLINKNI